MFVIKVGITIAIEEEINTTKIAMEEEQLLQKV